MAKRRKSRVREMLKRVQRWRISRRMRVEQLESRMLLAGGPSLISVNPNTGAIFNFDSDPAANPGVDNVLEIAPRELTLRFASNPGLDPATLGAIRITRAGLDGAFGDSNDVLVIPGFLGFGETDRVVVARFAETLPDDLYRIEVFAADLPADGISTNPITGIRNLDGVLLVPSDPIGSPDRERLFFELHLGPQVVSVVPQPVSRTITGALQQSSNTIEVYFNDRDLDSTTVTSSSFYQLLETNQTLAETDDTLRLPQSVSFNPTTNSATLTFASIPTGTYHLRVGESEESNGTIATAINVGTLFDTTTFTSLTYLGDVQQSSSDANDIDLYAVRLTTGQQVNVVVDPDAALNAVVRVFTSAGTELGTPANAAGLDGAEAVTVTATADGVYYIGVSSNGNSTYNAGTDSGSGGQSSGSYRVTIMGSSGRPLPGGDNNSSLATSSDLGVLGHARQVLTALIEPQNFLTLPAFPGGNDEPGHRHIPVEDHLNEYGPVLGGVADLSPGVQTVTYNFQQNYGLDPQNVPLQNEITENQRQRAREIVDLWSRYLGIQFVEADCTGITDGTCSGITIATGDLRAVDPLLPPGQLGPPGVFGNGKVVINGSTNWGQSEYGGAWFTAAMHEIGHAMGLGHSFDIQSLMGAGITGEPVFPGDHDIVHGQRIHRPDSNDVDLYKFTVSEVGSFRAETTAERLPTSSTLNTALRLYAERTAVQFLSSTLNITDGDAIVISDGTRSDRFEFDNQIPGTITAGNIRVPFSATSTATDLAAALAEKINDKKLSTISLRATAFGSTLQLSDRAAAVTLSAGLTARVRVFAASELIAQNDDYFSQDSLIEVPLQPGVYYLGVSSSGNTDYDPAIDNTGANGRTQGAYDLKIELNPTAASSIQDTTPGEALSLDGDADGLPGGSFDFWFRSAPTVFVDKARDLTPVIEGNGTLANPWDNIASALANAPANSIVRVVGNAGPDLSLANPADAKPYLIGLNNLNQPLPDGVDVRVPRNVTLMIDAGALLKLQKANIDVGTSSQGVDRSGGALQVLGTPTEPVVFRSFRDDSVGGNSDGVSVGSRPGDWGGLVLRDDSDLEQHGIFLNWVNNADLREGGGKVDVGAGEQVFSPIHLIQSRPTVSWTTISRSADAALSADPDSFDDSLGRIGPDIHHIRLTNNSVNGLFVRLQTPLGGGVDELDSFARWDDDDVVHVLTDKFVLAGHPGGSLEGVARLDARLQIDPGVVVKLQGARIHAEFGAQFIAEGTADLPIIFTSINDDRFGAAGSFDTKSDGNAAQPAPGDWSGLVFSPTSRGSLDSIVVQYAGGVSPVAGDVATFNAVEIHQADVRIANSTFALLAGGRDVPLPVRDDLTSNVDAAVFVRGAQPVLVNNIITDTTGRLINTTGVARFNVTTPFSGSSYTEAGLVFRPLAPSTTFRVSGRWSSSFSANDDNAQIDLATPGMFRLQSIFVGHMDDPDPVRFEGFLSGSSVGVEILDERVLGSLDGTTYSFNVLNSLDVDHVEVLSLGNTFNDWSFDNLQFTSQAADLASAVSTDLNSLNAKLVNDPGRLHGLLGATDPPDGNRGILLRGNRFDRNGINGLTVRGGDLQTEGVWDDTDIVHVVRNEIIVPNHHTFGGLRLESAPTESLVVKLLGTTAGFTATGTPLDIEDRIGGSIQIIGQPGFPVVVTSLNDCFVGAGFTPDGRPQIDTQTSGKCSTGSGLVGNAGEPGDWRSVRLDRYSNDRNVERIVELEPAILQGRDRNAAPIIAETLGSLAPNEKSGDENRRLGFEITGAIALDNPGDVDVYSFSANGGTEVWIDLDRTRAALDTMVELINVDGTVLARSLDNTPVIGQTGAAPIAFPLIKDPLNGIDWYSTNDRDAGLRVVLPGSTGPNAYFIRVRSQPSPGNEDNVTGGLSRGEYQLQVRLRQQDETPGSTVRYSDIRFATNGIEAQGLPNHSPLTGETAEANDATNNNFGQAQSQDLGNVLGSDRNSVSVAGSVSGAADVDWYQFTLDYDLVEAINGVNDGTKTFATIFDLDYADGLSRADTVLSVFDDQGHLIMVSRDSDVEDDQPKPGEGNVVDDLSRGSVGKLDPYIGTVQMPAGNLPANSSRRYFVAVSSNRQLPSVLNASFAANSTNTTVRLEPIDSLRRVVEDHIGFTGFTTGTSGPLGMSQVVAPETGPMFDLDNATELSVHVAPFTLADVQLYVATSSGLSSVNPFDGQFNYFVGQLAGFNTLDITMRSDGRIFGADFVPGNTANLAGRFTEIDPATGTEILNNDVAIPDFAAATNPENLGELTTDSIDALAFPRNRSNVFYSVRGAHRPGGIILPFGTSTLYDGDPNTGAAVAVNRRGEIIGNGVLGVTTGLAFDRFGSQLYGVNDQGQFYRLSQFSGFVQQLIGDFSVDLFPGESFSGLTLGPQNVENGTYGDMLFASTTRGRIFALDPNQFATGGRPVNFVFDTNNDRLADSNVVATGTGLLTGLAFSPLDFNLWHPTTRRGALDEPGHGINNAFDDSRNPGSFNHLVGPLGDRRLRTEQQGGASMYFGLEQFPAPGVAAPYFRYLNNGQTGQYGVLSSTLQSDLTAGAAIGDNYNLPGGAQGRLLTNAFSLEEYTRTDKPTLYFNYFLDTENDAGSNNGGFADSARVFVSRNDGLTWELLATNNPLASTSNTGNAELPNFYTPSRDGWSTSPNQDVQQLFNGGGWRQARVDLADYAGERNLKFRFDFSTAGNMRDNTLPSVAENSGIGFNNVNRARLNDFEGFYVDDILVGFAERGEMVTAAPPDATAFTALPVRNAAAPQEILTGPYQLEIRRGTEITLSRTGDLGEPILPTASNIFLAQQFGTNDRLAAGRSFIAPNGASIIDGQQFTISDGVQTRVFEFDRGAPLPGAGVVRIVITGSETTGEVANKVATAINSVSGWNVKAITKPIIANSPIVDLVGATLIDFAAGNATAELIVSSTANSISETGANSTTVARIFRSGDITQPLIFTLTGIDPTTGIVSDEVLLRNPSAPLVPGTNPSNPLTITIPANQPFIDIDVLGQADGVADGIQPVRLVPTAAGFVPVTDTVDVTDVETPQLLLSINTGVISEIGGTAIGTVTRNTPIDTVQTVNLTAHLTRLDRDPNIPTNAPYAAHEISIPLSVNIPIGSNSVTFGITAIDDGVFDGDQTVRITASANTFRSGSASIQVLDEGDLQVTLANSQINEPGAPGGTFTTATITRSGSTANPLTVIISATDVQPGTLTNEVTLTDPLTSVTANPLTITIAAGSTSASVNITSQGDSTPDGDQFVDITAIAGASSARATLEVIDQDPRTLSLAILPARVSEAYSSANGNAPATWIRVQRAGNLDLPATVTFDPTPADVTIATPSVIIPAGRTFIDVPVLTNNDANPSPPDSDPAPVTITARLSATTFASATLNVDDNENNYILSVTPSQVVEGNDNSTRGIGNIDVRRPFTGDGFTVTVSAAPAGHIRLPAGDAAQPDFENISFAGGQTARAISLDTSFNTINDHERLVSLAVTGGATADLWVADDEDPTLTVLINKLEISENLEQATVTVIRPNIPSLLAVPLQIQVQVNDPDRSSSPPSDETRIIATNNALVTNTFFVIPQNQTSVTFNIQGINDNLVDADYDLSGDGTRQRVYLTASVSTTAPQRYNRGIVAFDVRDVDQANATLSFFDRAGQPVAFISERDGLRAASGRISVTNLEGRASRGEWGDPNSLPITFNVFATDLFGANAVGNELGIYGGNPSAPTQVVLPAGAAAIDFDVDTIDDGLLDGDQLVSFALTASDPRFGLIPRNPGGAPSELTVRDNPPAPRRLILDAAVDSISEGGSTTLNVVRTGDLSTTLTVTLTAPPDVLLVPTVITFAPGSSIPTSGPVQVTGLFDGIADGTRTVFFDVDRSDFTLNGYEITTDSLDVLDFEIPQLSVQITGIRSFDEDDGRAVTRGLVTRNTPTDQPLVVTLYSSDATEAQVATTVTIPAFATSVAFNIDAVDELLTDGVHTVTITAAATKHLSGSATVDVTSVDNSTIYQRLGDGNIERDQGQLVISSNIIRDVSEYGVRIEAGPRSANNSLSAPGPVRNLPTLNTERLAPGPFLVNNVFANEGRAGILFSGDSVVTPAAAAPFGKIVNNTFFGGSTLTGSAFGVGIEVTNRASPTILNNIFSILVNAVTTNNNGSATVVINANLFHGVLAQGSDAISLAATTPLFVNSSQLNFYPVSGSLAIDSSRNSLADRGVFINVKSPLGIPESPIVAPNRDLYGQLRIDDSSQNQSFGFGSDVFKDRGAVDRADSLGPFAVLAVPLDNDPQGVDLDPNATVVQLRSGNLSVFQLLLQDGRGVDLPFEGTGINPLTVNGNSIFVTENGVPLTPGVDFALGFNPSNGTILLTPTSGIWRPSSAYVILLNNRDRFLITAPSFTGINDGDQFRITDQSGGTAVFEYESGYRLSIPETLTMTVPAAGGGAGGIVDGQTFTVQNGLLATTFEFDNNANSNAQNFRIAFAATDSASTIANKIVAALQTPTLNLGLQPRIIPGSTDKIHLGATIAHIVDVANSSLDLTGSNDVLADGDTFRVQYTGGATPIDIAFEFDLDGVSDPLNTVIGFPTLSVPIRPHTQEIVDAIITALSQPSLNLPAIKDVGDFLIQIGGTTNHVLTLGGTSKFTLSGLPGVATTLRLQVPAVGAGIGGIADGEQFTVSRGAQTITFEFDSDNAVSSGAVPISFSPGASAATIATAIVNVLSGAGLGLAPQALANNQIVLGEPAGVLNYAINTSNSKLIASGVSGGAIPIFFEPVAAFTSQQFAGLIAAAILDSPLVGVTPTPRGGGQLFLDGATAVTGITSSAIQAIRDNAGNALRANQPAPGAETQFTILTPGVELDFGDSPDNSTTVAGGFATLLINDGARHAVLSHNRLFFGSTNADLDTEEDAIPSPLADGDNNNGVNDELLGNATVTGTGITISRVITPGVGPLPYRTPILVNATEAGFVDAWIDFNRDGKWDDATEKILSAAAVQKGANTLLAAPTPSGIIPTGQLSIDTIARFRISTTGGLLPSGLAVNGEVEDHLVTIITNADPTVAAGIADKFLCEDNNSCPDSNLTIDLSNAFTDIDLANGHNDELTLTVVGNDNPSLLQVAIDDTNSANTIDGDRLTIALAPNQHGTAVIRIRATDHADRFVETSFTVTVAAVNDPPVVTAPASLAAVEDILKPVFGISIADIDVLEGTGALTGMMRVTLRATHGRVTVRTNVPNGLATGEVTGNGSSLVTITALLSSINQTLQQSDGVSYQGNLNYNGPDSIVISPDDLGNFGLPPSPALPSADKTIAITVTAVNDTPTISQPAILTVNEDDPTGLTLTGLQVNDVDITEGTGAARVTLSVTNGRIKLAQTTGLVISNGADNTPSMTLDGSLAAINAAINGAHFFSNSNFNGLAALSVNASDLGNSPGPVRTANSTFVITVNAVNDAPQFTQLGGNQTVNEDSGRRTVPGFVTNVSAGPADESGQLLNFRITLSDRIGTLEFVNDLPTIDPVTGSLVFEPKPNTNGSVVVQVRLEDNGGTANGGQNTFPVPPADPVIFTITVNALNDAPEFTKGGNDTVPEDLGLRSIPWATGIRSGPTTALDEQAQTLSFNVSLAQQVVGNLAFATFPTINPATGVLTYQTASHTNGQAVLRVSLSDNGAINPPNSNTSAAQTFTITVTPVNDAPEFTLAGSPSVDEDASLQTISNFITNVRPGPVQATDESSGLTAQGLSVQVTRIPPPVPSPNDLAFANLPQIDLTNGALAFQPLPNSNGAAVFRVRLTDSGSNTPPNVNFSDQTFTITVNPINDPPSFIRGADIVVDEDAGLVSRPNWATNVVAGPPNEAAQAASLAFHVSVVSTTRTLGFATAPAVASDGTLNFTSLANTNGTAVVRVSLSDNETGTPPNDNTSDDQTFTITVNAVNDPPQLINPVASFSVNEDAPVTVIELFPTVFADVDVNPFDGDTMTLRVLSNSNPQLVGTQLDNPLITSATTTSNLRLTYQANRNGQAELVVEASDQFGTTARDTFTVTVNAVNDAPVIGGPTIANPALFQPREDQATAVTGITIDDVDVTDNAGGRLNVTLSVGQGILTLRTDVAGGLVSNDVTANGTSSVSINTTPAALNATLAAANGLTYSSLLNFNGPDQFTITVNDNGNSPSVPLNAVATLNFSVSAVNDAPTAGVDFVTTPEDTLLSFNSSALRTNDAAGPANENSQTLTVTAVGTTPTTSGLVSLQGNTIVYSPSVDFVGTDVFTYTITDNGQTNGTLAPLSAVGTVTVTITSVNDPPTPAADSQTTAEDTVLVFDAAVLGENDKPGAIDPTTLQLRSIDEAAQVLTVLSVGATSQQGGSVALISGSIRYTPPADFFGTDTFTYVVQDNGTSNGQPDPKQSIGTATVTVTAVNDAPIAVTDTRAGREGTPLVFNAGELAQNDSAGPANESSQTLTVDAGSTVSANGGSVIFNAGIITYNPPRDFNGQDTFTYTLRDSGTVGANDRRSSVGTVVVNVVEVNNAPVAVADAHTTAEDTPLVISAASLTANDSRGPANESGQTLTISAVSAISAQGGAVTFNSNTGEVTYSPATNFNGIDTFTYSVTDNGTTAGVSDPKSGSTTVTVTVSDVNDPPIPFADNSITAEDGTLTLAASVLLANDTRGSFNENTQNLSVTGVGATSQAGGTVTLVGGVITYTPPRDFNGFDSFTYTVRDDGSSNGIPDPRTATGLVNVTVTPVNDAPLAIADLFAGIEDTTLDLNSADVTVNDQPGPGNEATQLLTVTAVSATSSHGGAVSLANGRIVYTPPTDFSGRDTFTYTVQDDGTTNGAPDVKTAVGTVTVEVSAQNDPPIVVGDAYAIDEDSRLIVAGNGVLANDFDRDLPPQLLTVANPALITVSTRGARVAVNSDGTFTYDPTQATSLQALRPGQTLQDTFVYKATDGTDLSTEATVNISVSGRNDAPVANHDSYAVDEDQTLNVASSTGVLQNDNDPEGSTLTATLVSSVGNGVLTLRPDGSFSYTPRRNFSGRDSFVYRASDGSTSSDAATVVIDVNPTNDPPTANSDQYSVSRDGTLSTPAASGVLANDFDSDGGILTARLVQNPSHGQVTLNIDGSFTYRPTAGFSGSDTFIYRAVDSNNVQSDSAATVTITVTNNRPWQNPIRALDVNNDGSVSAIDVLQIINRLNNEGPHVLVSPPDALPPPFVDVNGDGSVTPNDPLVVINFLNSSSGSPEGESSDLSPESGTLPNGDARFVVMPMTSGRPLQAEVSSSRRASAETKGLDGYFAELGQADDSAEPVTAAITTFAADESEESIDGFLQSLDDVFATSEDGLESLR